MQQEKNGREEFKELKIEAVSEADLKSFWN